MTDERSGEIEPETAALYRLQRAMSDAESALGRRMALHPTDMAAMAFLAFTERPVGPGDLAQRLGLSPAAATELADRLTAAGHIARRRDLADRRRIRLEPTGDAMDAVLGHLMPLIAAIDVAARDGTPDERAAVVRFLGRAVAIYEGWIGEQAG